MTFEIDHTDPAFQTGWSVMVSGFAEEALSEAHIKRLEQLPLRPWAPGAKDHWVVITPESMTGRRVVALEGG